MNKKINVPEELINDLERAHYSYNEALSTKVELLYLYSQDVSFIDTPVYKKMENDCIEKLKEYDKMKNKLSNYIVETVGPGYNWDVVFETKEVLIHTAE